MNANYPHGRLALTIMKKLYYLMALTMKYNDKYGNDNYHL